MSAALSHRWRKLASAKWADAWEERLRGLDPARLAVTEAVGGRALRFEFYGSARETRALVRSFGGNAEEVRPESWQPRAAAADALPHPLAFGRRLLVTSDAALLPSLRAAHPRKAVLAVPAALAFGTGAHATTAMVLRLLAASAERRRGSSWTMLDLGAGSGILALAARALGARSALGLDYDPDAVRTARANARANALARVPFRRADAQEWNPAGQRWDVIAANVFANLLVLLLPRLAAALAPGGELFLSGVLADQAPAIADAARRAGLRVEQTQSRGPWRALWCQPAK